MIVDVFIGNNQRRTVVELVRQGRPELSSVIGIVAHVLDAIAVAIVAPDRAGGVTGIADRTAVKEVGSNFPVGVVGNGHFAFRGVGRLAGEKVDDGRGTV